MTMLPPPERESFEREIKQFFNDGDLTKISAYLQKDRSLISKAFNPDVPEKNNPVYQIVVYLWAFDCLREGLADEILKIVHRERDKWTGEQTRILTNPAETTTHIGIQFCEFMETELKNLSFDEQLKELVDVQEAVEIKKQELLSRRSERYYGTRK